MSTLTRAFAPILLVVALALPAAATAGGSKPKPKGACVQYNKITHATKCYPKGTVVTPVAHPITPPNGTTAPPVTPPVVTPSVPAPPVNSQEPTEAFCVQTLQRGETFVQANTDSFSPGGSWYDLTVGGATVTLDGHDVTLLWERGEGVILAAKVPTVGGAGYVLTCGQPFVSTDGKYQDERFGLRGEEWDAAFAA